MYTYDEAELLRRARIRSDLPLQAWRDETALRRMIAESRAAALRGAFAGLRRAVSRWLAIAMRWSSYRAAVAELESLDARTLADIGITRGDIHAVASGHLLRDATPVATGVVPGDARNDNRRKIAA